MGRQWLSVRHPHLLPVKVYDLERYYSTGAYSLFPLKANKFTRFGVQKGLSGEKPDQLTQTCEVSGTETVEVSAGIFWTFKIFCRRDGFFETYYYSPSLGHYVIRERERLLRFMRAELVSYSKAAPLKFAKIKSPATKKTQTVATSAAKSSMPFAVNNSKSIGANPLQTSASFSNRTNEKLVLTVESYQNIPDQKIFGVQIGAYLTFNAALMAYKSVILPAAPEILSSLGVNYWTYKIPKTGEIVVRIIVGEYQNWRAANRVCSKIKSRNLECWVNTLN